MEKSTQLYVAKFSVRYSKEMATWHRRRCLTDWQKTASMAFWSVSTLLYCQHLFSAWLSAVCAGSKRSKSTSCYKAARDELRSRTPCVSIIMQYHHNVRNHCSIEGFFLTPSDIRGCTPILQCQSVVWLPLGFFCWCCDSERQASAAFFRSTNNQIDPMPIIKTFGYLWNSSVSAIGLHHLPGTAH